VENDSEFELRWVVDIMRHWWWLIPVCTLLAAASGYAVTANMRPKYEASTTLLVELGQDGELNEYNALVAGERLALTYTQMLKSRPVLEQVIAELGLVDTPEQLAKKVSAEPIRDTQLIRLQVTTDSPEQSAWLADAIAMVFIKQIQEQALEQYTASLTSLQEQIDTSSALLNETLEKIDGLRSQKTGQETQLRKLESQLEQYRSDYQEHQREYQSLQLTVAQLTDNVKTIDEAQIPGEPILLPYTAIVTLLIDQAPIASEGDYSAILASERLAQTYAEILESSSVLAEAIAQLGLEERPDRLAKKVKAEPVPDTQLLRLSVTDFDPNQAALLANTISEVFIEQIQVMLAEPYDGRLDSYEDQLTELSQQIEETQSAIDTLNAEWVQSATQLARLENLLEDYRGDQRALLDEYKRQQQIADDATRKISIVENAIIPEEPAQRRTLYIILAAMVGAIGALGIAFLIEYLNDTLRTAGDVRRALDLEILGAIGRYAKPEEGLVMIAQPLSPTAEAFRTLSTNLRQASANGPLRTLMITSPKSKEGKSFTVANLAVAFARFNLKVVVVDADLRLPDLHKLFGVKQTEGLTATLHMGVMDGKLQSTGIEGLSVLTSGESDDNPAELMNSPHMHTLLDKLAQQSDLVLIDCPPVLPVADAKILASCVDGVLLVVRAGSTHTRAAKEAVRGLRQSGANLVGVILNTAPGLNDRYYKYYQHGKEEGKSFLKR
jgi:capsular exopolysaccharide synthesis family protein